MLNYSISSHFPNRKWVCVVCPLLLLAGFSYRLSGILPHGDTHPSFLFYRGVVFQSRLYLFLFWVVPSWGCVSICYGCCVLSLVLPKLILLGSEMLSLVSQEPQRTHLSLARMVSPKFCLLGISVRCGCDLECDSH